MLGHVGRQFEIGLAHALHAVADQGAEKPVAPVQVLQVLQAADLLQLLQCGSQAVESGHILAELAPGADEGNRAQVLEILFPATAAARRPAGDIRLTVIAHRAHLLQIRQELGVRLELLVALETDPRQFFEQFALLQIDFPFDLVIEIVFEPRGQ